MTAIPTQTLRSGDEIPVVGAGTWNLSGETLATALDAAFDAGYTHVDAAEGYHNEADVGAALDARNREDLFLTSKVLPSNLHYESVFDSLETTLSKLGTDYLDLYLIHWPNPAISLRETFRALERAHERGLVRNVGVSNFTKYHLRFARKIADVPIAVNQVEFHPWYYREDLLGYCQHNDIVVEAASPLARTRFLDDPVVEQVADRHDRTPAQIALKWAVDKGVVVLPKSGTPAHVAANCELFDWDLTDDEVAAIDDIDTMENVYMVDPDDETYGIRP